MHFLKTNRIPQQQKLLTQKFKFIEPIKGKRQLATTISQLFPFVHREISLSKVLQYILTGIWLCLQFSWRVDSAPCGFYLGYNQPILKVLALPVLSLPGIPTYLNPQRFYTNHFKYIFGSRPHKIHNT